MKLTGAVAEKGFHAFEGEPRGQGIPRVWIVVAGSRHAHVFRRDGDAMQRIADAQPGGGDVQEMPFVQQFSRWLAEAEREQAFDRLVIVGSHRTLCDIRAVLPPDVQRRISAEVDWELMGLPELQVRESLAKIVWF